MSLDSAHVAAPLQYESWNELRVKADPLSWTPPYAVHNTNYYFKLVHDAATASACLIVTDLCFVWLTRMEQKQIDADMKASSNSNSNHSPCANTIHRC